MWPFHGRKRRARRKALQLARYLSPELIEALANAPDAPPRLQQATIPYIILQVRDDDLAQVPDYLDRASDAVLEAGGTILSIMSSVVAVAFGLPVRSTDDGIVQRDQAVARPRSDLGSSVRAIFGHAGGLYGAMGRQRMTYGALLPGFGGRLERLLRLEFGTLTEA